MPAASFVCLAATMSSNLAKAVRPLMAELGQAILKPNEGAEIKAAQLWEQQPVCVIVLRRPGCVLCRAEAQQLWSDLQKPLQDLGVGMACVVHEWRQPEIDAFAPAFWPGPLYHDTSKSFYSAVHGGKIKRGSLWPLLNPASAFWGRIRQARKVVKEHNVVGDGLTMGGLMVIGQAATGSAATPYLVHAETELGLMAPHDAILAAAKEASAARKTVRADKQ